METQNVVNIPFNKLVRSPKNVRVVDPDIAANRELIANIRANGVLQNLAVVPTETKDVYAFVDGGRRRARHCRVWCATQTVPRNCRCRKTCSGRP